MPGSSTSTRPRASCAARPPGALQGRRIDEFVGGRELEKLVAAREAAVAGDESKVLIHMRRPTSDPLPVEVRFAPLSLEQFLCTGRDVSAWVDPERAREAAAQRYRHALEESIDGILMLDDEDRLVYANRAGRDLLGLREAPVAPLPLDGLVTVEEPERLHTGLRDARRDGEASWEMRCELPKRGAVLFSIDAIALQDGGCQAFVQPREVA